MTENLRFYAVGDDSRPLPLPVPESVTGLHDLYTGLPVGVYTVFRTFQHNKFLCLEKHMERTEQSMELLGWDLRFPRRSFLQVLHQVCTGAPWQESRIRLDVLERPASRLGVQSRVLIALMPLQKLPARLYEKGVSVAIAFNLARKLPQAKTADFAFVRENTLLPQQGEVFEFLLTDDDGNILEGASSNFYGVRDGVVWTAGEGVLEGITRITVLELIRNLEIPLEMKAVPLTEVPFLDEAIISSSTRGLLPVARIVGQSVGDGSPGPIYRQLSEAYWKYVDLNVHPAVEHQRT